MAVEKDRLLKEVVPYNLGLPGGGEERLAKRRRESWEGEEAKEEGESSEEGGQSGGEAEAEEDDESEEGEGSEGGESREAEMRLTAREEKGMRLLAFHTGILQEPQGEGGSSGPTDDCPSRVIAALDPPELRRVLLSMARRTPRTLEAMLLFGLTPLATELMTRSFEAGDVAEEPGVGKCGVGEAGPGFYEEIYSVCEDKALVMQAMVGRKEALSKEACRLVLVRQLCMTSDLVGPPPTAFPE